MQKNLTIIAGYNFTQPFQIVAIDEANVEYDYDLTNCTITAVAKPTANSCKSYEFDVTITVAAEGKFVISMDSALTDTITETSLVYDIKVNDTNSSNIFRAAYGTIAVTPEITP